MDQTLTLSQVDIGFHTDGYKIDKTTAPINHYTKWEIQGCRWNNPKPIDFASLPKTGWIKADKFDWDNIEIPVDITEPRLLGSGD